VVLELRWKDERKSCSWIKERKALWAEDSFGTGRSVGGKELEGPVSTQRE
jgi:hypothetical protein